MMLLKHYLFSDTLSRCVRPKSKNGLSVWYYCWEKHKFFSLQTDGIVLKSNQRAILCNIEGKLDFCSVCSSEGNGTSTSLERLLSDTETWWRVTAPGVRGKGASVGQNSGGRMRRHCIGQTMTGRASRYFHNSLYHTMTSDWRVASGEPRAPPKCEFKSPESYLRLLSGNNNTSIILNQRLVAITGSAVRVGRICWCSVIITSPVFTTRFHPRTKGQMKNGPRLGK